MPNIDYMAVSLPSKIFPFRSHGVAGGVSFFPLYKSSNELRMEENALLLLNIKTAIMGCYGCFLSPKCSS